MSNRYELNMRCDALRAGLARAERDQRLMATPLRSSELYALALQRIDQLMAEIDSAVDEALR